nr:truncated RdRP-like protein [Rhabdoviridae sp.]
MYYSEKSNLTISEGRTNQNKGEERVFCDREADGLKDLCQERCNILNLLMIQSEVQACSTWDKTSA